MSRIGKKPVAIPAGVEVKMENGIITVKGPKGELTQPVDEKLVSVKIEDGNVIVERDDDTKEKRSAHGLYRTLIHNMVSGVTEGFEKKLELVGVGYRVEKKGDTLVLNLGYSHPIEMKDPEGITTEAPSQTEIIIKGIDKEQVGNYAAVIRKHRPPEPYKGKGIKYTGEVIIRKEGKSGAK
ncbi:MAG: 50S ribosomal protein L6 [Anaerovoracaceae bacterium]|nr:50S ribosomal protein L6 [Bacillota bacterium]MDY5906714.1 50S ribosomal protein L6 [Anaerovoracaceae bacterium]